MKKILYLLFVLITLTACSNGTNKYIEIGMNDSQTAVKNIFYEWKVGIRCSNIPENKKEVNVFFGNELLSIDFDDESDYYKMDNSQQLRFDLFRMVSDSKDSYVHENNLSQTKIYSITNSLDWFMKSFNFAHESNVFKDEITISELNIYSNDTGCISYKFVITAIDSENIELYRKSNETGNYEYIYEGSSIKSNMNGLLYSIEDDLIHVETI